MTFVLPMTLLNTVCLEKAESFMGAQFKADGACLTPCAINVSFYTGRDFWGHIFYLDFHTLYQM
jgi:hypothetical protein